MLKISIRIYKNGIVESLPFNDIPYAIKEVQEIGGCIQQLDRYGGYFEYKAQIVSIRSFILGCNIRFWDSAMCDVKERIFLRKIINKYVIDKSKLRLYKYIV